MSLQGTINHRFVGLPYTFTQFLAPNASKNIDMNIVILIVICSLIVDVFFEVVVSGSRCSVNLRVYVICSLFKHKYHIIILMLITI